MRPKVIDLFAGVGGLSLGFEQHGFDVVLANEYDASIAAAYQLNHKNTKMIVGDITSLNLEEVFGKYKGEIDVVIGGPPSHRKVRERPYMMKGISYLNTMLQLWNS